MSGIATATARAYDFKRWYLWRARQRAAKCGAASTLRIGVGDGRALIEGDRAVGINRSGTVTPADGAGAIGEIGGVIDQYIVEVVRAGGHRGVDAGSALVKGKIIDRAGCAAIDNRRAAGRAAAGDFAMAHDGIRSNSGTGGRCFVGAYCDDAFATIGFII